MRWLNAFLAQSSLLPSDNSDKRPSPSSCRTEVSIQTKTGPPPSDKSARSGDPELLASMERLETAGVWIAILDDGTMRLVQSEVDPHKLCLAGITSYSAQDCYFYVRLNEHSRQMFREFKKRYRASTEWKVGTK